MKRTFAEKAREWKTTLEAKIGSMIKEHNDSEEAHSELFSKKSKVTFSRTLNTGTKIGTLNIDGDNTDLYCEKDTNTTYSTVTQSANGLMSKTDKIKLDNIEESANNYTHPSYTVRTGKPTSNQTPGFGETATVSQITSDSTGHVTGATDRTIKIPNTLGDGETAGLSTNNYTTEEKEKLNGISASANNYSHPTYTARTGKPTGNQTPAFGGTATISQITSDGTGHVTGATDRTIKIPNTTASSSSNGLMTKEDKIKLDDIEESANNYSHPSYTAQTGKPTSNQTPGFGETATVSQITTDESGHVTNATDKTIKIPNTTATTSAAGLMSKDDKTKLNGIASSANNYSHPNSGVTAGTNYNSNQTPSFGGTFNIPKLTYNAQGHITASANSTVTIPSAEATQSEAGLMSKDDKTKLDGISSSANNYTHPSYTARTGKPTANQTPSFGGTATVSQITSDSNGHVTGATDRTITIPSSTATQSANGLMSKEDKKKLDGMTSNGGTATDHNHDGSYIKTGTGTVTSTNIADGTIVNADIASNAAIATSKISGLDTALSGKAPTSHAVNANTYGLGTSGVYGHVKVSDNTTSSAGNASQSVAASSAAVKTIYDIANPLKSKYDGYFLQQGSTQSTPFYRLFHIDSAASDSSSSALYFDIYEITGYNYARIGVYLRRNNSSSSSVGIKIIKCSEDWSPEIYAARGQNGDTSTSKSYVDIYWKVYNMMYARVKVVEDHLRNGTYTQLSPVQGGTETYTTVEAAATSLYNKAYNEIKRGYYVVNADTIKTKSGTSSQFLKADGSIDSNTYSTTSHTHNYLPTNANGTTTGTLTATKFINSSSNNTNILLGNGNTLAQSTFATSGHNHDYSDTYAPKTHTHASSDVTGLTASLNVVTDANGKLSTEAKNNHTHSYVPTGNIKNDLTTGGASNVLSAEQGKTLNTNKLAKNADDTSTGYITAKGFKVTGAASGTFVKADGTTAAANNYSHPTNLPVLSSGMYKITTNNNGHITAGTAIQKADITALGIPAQDTTYTAASAAPLRLTATTGAVGTSTKYAREDHRHPRYVNYGESNTTADGYFKLFRVSVGSWCNQPFIFKIIRRGATQDINYKLRFTNVNTDTTLPTVSSLYHDGDDFNLWVYDNQNKTFDIIVKEPETYFTCNIEFYDAMNLSITDLKTRLTATEFNALTAANLTKSTYIGFTSTEKTKLAGIATNANNYSHPSTHAASMITGLATVATSGSYNDLSNKPTIPSAYSHPTHTALSSGLYKITTNTLGHVTAGTAVTIDSTPANNANNLVSSQGVYNALAGKANTHDHPYAASSHTSVTANSSTLGHVKAFNGTTTAIGTSANNGTDNGLYARGDHTHNITKATITGLGISASDHTHASGWKWYGNDGGQTSLASGGNTDILTPAMYNEDLRLVRLIVEGTAGAANGGSKGAGTIPSTYRPSKRVSAIARIEANIFVVVDTDGSVKVKNNSSQAGASFNCEMLYYY